MVWAMALAITRTTPRSREGAGFHPLLCGQSTSISSARADLELFARHEVAILLEGESGSGKTLFAEQIHAMSPRAAQPLVPIVLTEIEDALIASELFGHEKGAFTGATAMRTGLLESAARGTAFLDEIGKATATAQARLLTVVETGRFRRVGGNRWLKPDLRFVLASNVPLIELVDQGRFLPDLFERIRTFAITVPSLGQRRGDIEQLLHFLVAQEAPRMGYATVPAIEREIVERFLVARWPGNLRQLHEAVKVLLIGGRQAAVITSDHIHSRLNQMLSGTAASRGPTRDEVLQALARHGSNRTEAARELGCDRTTVHRCIRRWGISG